MHLVIYESQRWRTLAPLTFARPTFSLLCGATTLLERQVRCLGPNRLTLWVREPLCEMTRRHIAPAIAENLPQLGTVTVNQALDGEPVVLLDGATVYKPADSDHVPPPVSAPGLTAADALTDSAKWRAASSGSAAGGGVQIAQYLWDLLAFNEQAIRADAAVASSGTVHATADLPDWAHALNPAQILAGKDVVFSPGCVVDASKGPVILAAGAVIGANAVVQGPCYIGAGSEISPLACIRPGTSIGPRCKIGGEVARAIVLGNSNKAHEGFLGDSYLGEWVNLGAGTTTSNLKNTYGPITLPLGTTEINTGRQFLGSLIGDHSKTAIGTRLMCGSYVGQCAMIATAQHAPRMTASFSFLTDRGCERYRMEKAIEVARAVYARRQRAWTDGDALLIEYASRAAAEIESDGGLPVQ
jgi:UDP-N-acetylglucosamine diphosphorylase/glucosamine-1-phosphate N-acetyltransferase